MPPTILCADDSPTIQKVVELTFSDRGVDVVCASNGEEAIRRFRELSPDLVLLDTEMPAPDGYEVCALLKSEAGAGAPPVVLMYGAFEPFDTRGAAAAGADGHIAKPFEESALLDRAGVFISLEPATARTGSEPSARVSTETPGTGLPAASLREGAEPASFEELMEEMNEERLADRAAPSGSLSGTDLDAIAHRVAELIGPEVVREIAESIVPSIVESCLRSRAGEPEPVRGDES